MARVYNFSAGPSTLPEPVLAKAASEMMDYGSSGQSVMEMSHRSKVYEEIISGCESLLRETMKIPDNYKVLFLQGGASSQFSMVPMNLLRTGKADYMVTGQFSGKAYDEAKRYGDIALAGSSKDKNFTYIPQLDKAAFRADADYVHVCYNNTIYGSTFNYIPDTGDVPLVADMSSFILSQPIDVSKFGVIYAGAQKNMAPAGVTIVIIREDLLGFTLDGTPTMYDYKLMADNDSMYNTPPCYSIYVCKMVLEWIRDEMGGLEGMKAYNEKKAAVLYDYLDKSEMFSAPVEKEYRSLMNVTFVTGDDNLDKEFCNGAEKAGFVNIKGHRSVGGMRASIYNAMPIEGVEKLVAYMADFEAKHK